MPGICIDAVLNSWTGWTWWGICVEIEEATDYTTTGMNRFRIASVYCYFLGLLQRLVDYPCTFTTTNEPKRFLRNLLPSYLTSTGLLGVTDRVWFVTSSKPRLGSSRIVAFQDASPECPNNAPTRRRRP